MVNREATMKDETPTPDIIEVGHTELLNMDYEPLGVVTQDGRVTVKIGYTVKDDQIKRPAYGVAIRTVGNHYVCGLDILLDDVQIPWKKERNVSYLEYEKVSLLIGKYYFDIAFFEGHATVPLVCKAKYVMVFTINRYTGRRIVILDHKWRDTTKGEAWF